jgi:hypothetical protein
MKKSKTSKRTAGQRLRAAHGSAICECRDWCDLDLRPRLLTGHHATCKYSHPLKSAYELIAALARGMEHWARDEDGIHPDAWEAYRKAKALEGVILPNVKTDTREGAR